MSEQPKTDTAATIHELLNGTSGVSTKSLEPWLWEAACSIRGAMDAPKYRDYILPLIFLKRLSDVYSSEIEQLAARLGGRERAERAAQADKRLVRVFIPKSAQWETIRNLKTNVGQELTRGFRELARENPELKGVVDLVDFNATINGQRVVEDERLKKLIEILNRQALGLRDVEPDVLGRAYEYLLRKFAENQGQSAGEFFTPKEVGWLVAELVDPSPGESVHDPAAGSSGLLIKADLLRRHSSGSDSAPLKIAAQERLSTTFALSKMNCFIHDIEADIEPGDTLRTPKFQSRGTLQKFDIVVANPMWNQPDYDQKFYDADSLNRFSYGAPPANTADFAWVQHIASSLKDSGRAAVVLDTNVVNRGSGASGKNRERDIRKGLVEAGLIDVVILLPENLFYNTGAPGVIVTLNGRARANGSRDVLLINASQEYVKGQPKNILSFDGIARVVEVHRGRTEVDGFSRRISIEELRDVDFDLSPGRHVVPPVRQREATMPEAEEAVSALEEQHAMLSSSRAGEAGRFVSVDEDQLTGKSKIGVVPADWKQVSLSEAVVDEFSGDYGDAEEAPGLELVRVLKATNFGDVAAHEFDRLVTRYVKSTLVKKKRIREGDLIVETSGGGKHAATGRVLYVTEAIASADPGLHPTNFTRVLRLDTTRFTPRFVYHYWRLLYDLGRTQPYERQPTQIRNFKHSNFLRNEFLPELPLPEQIELTKVLDLIEREEALIKRRAGALNRLRLSASFDVLSGLAVLQ